MVMAEGRDLRGSFRPVGLGIVLSWWALLVVVGAGPGRTLGLEQALSEAASSAERTSGSVSIHVVELASNRTIFELRPDESRIIASNTKLFTTAAALDGLGPGFFFETNVLMRGNLQAGRLDGDLAVVGGGDPNISGRHYEGDSLAVFRSWASSI